MLGLAAYRRTLCPRCGHPKDKAWHIDNEGHFEVRAEYVCHPCTVNRSGGEDGAEPVKYYAVVDTRDYEAHPLHGHYTDFGAPAETPPAPAPPTPREEALA